MLDGVTLETIVTIGLPSGVLALVAKGLVQWLQNRGAAHTTDRTVDAQLEEHWTKTTLELVQTLRSEVASAWAEIRSLRKAEARLAHFEEALDLMTALIAAYSTHDEPGMKSAIARATAFLKRMRGEQAGPEREAAQIESSADALIEKAKGVMPATRKDQE